MVPQESITLSVFSPVQTVGRPRPGVGQTAHGCPAQTLLLLYDGQTEQTTAD